MATKKSLWTFWVGLSLILFALPASTQVACEHSEDTLTRVGLVPGAPHTIALVGVVDGHVFRCASARGCWAFAGGRWYKFRKGDLLENWTGWYYDRFSLWRCYTCTATHLPDVSQTLPHRGLRVKGN